MIQEYFGIQLSGGVRLALSLKDLGTVESFPRPTICPIPGVAPYWLGVVNHRGSLLWLLDGDHFFNLRPYSERNQTKLTVVTLNHQVAGVSRQVGWSVATLEGILNLNPNKTLPWPDLLATEFESLFTAVVKHDDRPIFMLDSAVFFDSLHQPQAAVAA